MNPLERLLQEDIPTRPPPPPTPGPSAPWTPEEQTRHWTDLCEAIHGWHWQDDTSLSKKRRHLRLIRRGEAA